MLIISMQELREYRLRYGVFQNAIAKKMGKSRQFINQIELGTGNTWDASEETKKAYLQALYEVVMARQEK